TGALTTYLQPSGPGDIVAFNDQAVGNFNVSIPATVTPGGVTVENTAHDYTFTGAAIAGSFSLTKNGSGTLRVVNNNTFVGGTLINAGTVILGNGGTTGSLSTGPIASSGSLVINRSDNLSFTVSYTGAGSLTQAGPGTLTLPNIMTYLGGTFSVPGPA